jgi:DNA-binding transcriptional ArsR family regulator
LPDNELVESEGAARLHRALADPTRRTILDELQERDDQSLFELCARLAARHQISSSRQAISQHLAVLEEAGLVRSRRQSRTRLHTLCTEPLRSILERWPLSDPGGPVPAASAPTINLASVLVDDQDKALAFYTDILGFLPKADVPMGEHRWLTVVSPQDPDGVELVLEPDQHPAARVFKQALVADGIPFTSFGVADVQASYESLSARGVTFVQPPTAMGPVTTVVLDDTCGNLIQLASAA